MYTEIEPLTCYICTETNIPLFKICNCADSYLCYDCLILTENNINKKDVNNENKYKCHICRQKLNLYLLPNVKYFIKLIKHISIQSLFLLLDLLPVLYINYVEETKFPTMFYAKKGVFTYACLFHILLIKSANKFMFSYFYEIPDDNYKFYYAIDVLCCCVTILMFSMCFIHSNIQMMDMYTILNLFFNYEFGFLIMCIMLGLQKLGEIEKIMRLKYQYIKIHIAHSYFPTAEELPV